MRAEPHVLHLHSGAGLYGAEHMLLTLLPALEHEGVESTLLCLDNYRLDEQPLYERARAAGIATQRIPCRRRLDAGAALALRRVLRRRPGSLLHVHGYKSAFHAWLARGAGDTPIVSTLHGHIAGAPRLDFYQAIERRLLRRFDRVCVVSESMRAALIKSGVASERIGLIENGVDASRFRPDTQPLPRADRDIPADAFVFGSALRLSGEKNPLGLLDAFARVRKDFQDCHLALAGEGPLHAAIRARACELGIHRQVHLFGALADTERFYPMLDCFVLPSLSEGLPLALLEAMAAARPVVATAVGQVPRVLDGLRAALVPPCDIAALAASMRASREEIGGPLPELRQRVIERYSAARMARDYGNVYRGLRNGNDYAMA